MVGERLAGRLPVVWCNNYIITYIASMGANPMFGEKQVTALIARILGRLQPECRIFPSRVLPFFARPQVVCRTERTSGIQALFLAPGGVRAGM